MTRHRTREETSRSKSYSPPSRLRTPPPQDGVVYRYVRIMNVGIDDVQNLSMQLEDGWRPVKTDELKDWNAPVHTEGRFAGVYGIGDLILCKNSVERVEARKRYYEDMTSKQLASVNNDLFKVEDRRMPMSQRLRSDVTQGGGRRIHYGEAESGDRSTYDPKDDPSLEF